MDQDSTRSSSRSSGPAGGSKAAPYSKHVAGLIREGTVAERVSQLQAKISTQDPVSHPSPSNPIGESTLAYSLPKSLSTPKNVPLPESPIRRDHATNYTGQEDSTKSHYSVHKESDAPKDEQQHHGQISITELEKQAMEIQEKSRQHMERILQGLAEDSTQSDPTDSRDSDLVLAQKMAAAFSASFGNNSNQSPLSPEKAELRSPQSHLKSSYGSAKKTMSPSSGSAYSKILPFTSTPSIPSYIPRLQKQDLDIKETPSPKKLKGIMFSYHGFTDLGDENESQTPLKAPSPPVFRSSRHQDPRYQRRRTFNNKSDDDLGRNSATKAEEDVFVSPTKTTKPYHVEPPIMAGDSNTVSEKNSHDIQNSNYVPSVMPRYADYRSTLRKRPKADVGNSSGYSSVISSPDWNRLQGLFSTDGPDKESTGESKQSDKAKPTTTDGARSVMGTEVSSTISEDQATEPKMDSARPEHGDEAL